ncbi:glycosyltransferase family 2 protein [Amycolatopsis sp. PS_44_ISF1]|uniref:glycosyltransferase n=1 Tax=Amycolatopsis sp. PS_44_ISF1 TaxID=2974917 RepID=UPI0028DDB1A9|nr:glycosyltransferase family 2 protein [Amycolatopsis sp. PS_44_ISF1]MDT8913152.1 glycosyltransferase family 2 protein [Amycolatopsis sp. PS_44_ISF1]
MITAVAVVVPARDEAALVAGCLRAVHRSLLGLPVPIARTVVLVADRCTDETAELASAGGAVVVVSEEDRTIGEIRDLGCRRALALLPGHRPDRLLLLNTDADTEVTPGWAGHHLARAHRGWHATTGPAHLSGAFPGSPDAALRYRELVDTAERTTGNVYGANLAVRADAHTAVGGFGPTATGEDHSLWRRLAAAGYRLATEPRAVVHTSPRLDGRAPGGLASLLRQL